VKISLFDVSDVSKSRELAKVEMGDSGTDSPVLRDHKAFLFSRSKNLLVLPVLVAEIDQSRYSGKTTSNAYGEYVWQGEYVYHVSPERGFVLLGKITHLEDGDDLLKSGFYFESLYSVRRALYIGDVPYTISDKIVKRNSLASLEVLKRWKYLKDQKHRITRGNTHFSLSTHSPSPSFNFSCSDFTLQHSSLSPENASGFTTFNSLLLGFCSATV